MIPFSEMINAFGVAAITDADPAYPTADRIYRLNGEVDPDLAEEAEGAIDENEQRWGYNAYRIGQAYAGFGSVTIYDAQDYRSNQRDIVSGGMDTYGKRDYRTSEAVRNGGGRNQGIGLDRDVSPEDTQYSIPSGEARLHGLMHGDLA